MQTAIYKGSIEKKFLKAIFFLVVTVIMSAYTLFTAWYVYDQKERNILLAQDVTQVLSQDFVRLMLLDDVHIASDLTTKLQSFPDLNKVTLFDKNHKKIFQYITKKPSTLKDHFQTSTKLMYNQTYFGTIQFEFAVKSLLQILKDGSVILLGFLVFFLVLSLFLAKSYAKHFSQPILNLVNFLEKIDFKEKNKNYKISGYYDDEIGKLYEEINILFTKMFDFIRQRDRAKQELVLMKQFDSLTGLYNKNGFLENLETTLRNDDSQWNAMFYIKITNLRNINHVYGYQFGDYLLKETAKRIKKDFKDATLYASLAVGDFVIFYQSIHKEKARALQETQNIADTIVAIISQPINYQTKQLKPELYVGVDIFKDEKEPLQIVKHTNIALEVARESHQQVVYFDKSNELQIKEVFNVYEDLHVALKTDQLELYYQLQYNDEQKVIGAEALIRWNHPKFGFLTPNKFIPIAEKTDIIVTIGTWVIQKASQQLQEWQKNEQTKHWSISINISAKQFHQEDFITILKEAKSQFKFPPSLLKLELLESLFIEEPQYVAQKMKELKELGFRLSLDDFGTGFSSLQYLKNFPLDQIKVDQSFVMNMFKNKKDVHIIKSIIYLGTLLEMDVIAEGVEEKEHYLKLKELGCHYFQGYYFAKPQSISTINSTILKS